MALVKVDPLPPFDTRNFIERRYLINTLCRPWSGYLGGIHQGGYWIEWLIEEWQATFRCKYAIPCNSATSGLLASCIAADIGPGDVVWTSVYTMSATAACAKVLGADVRFLDIEPWQFSMDMLQFTLPPPKAIILTNLFGHPARYLKEIKRWCDVQKVVLIEDNAQSPFARMGEVYTGTIGHIGVFSLNIHKHLQTGEGGVVVTNDSDLAIRVKDAVNHGELGGGITGLNLRMTEPTAAVACAQLGKAKWIIESRRELASKLTEMISDYGGIIPPREVSGCTHVYYIWAAQVLPHGRDQLIQCLNECGFPMNKGYSPLLSRVFKTHKRYTTAEAIEDESLITFDVCSYSPKKRHLKQMKEIFHQAMESFR